MKVNLAVYTAQEGYAWQPGTAFTSEELYAFKKSIGKFPSPDAADFPFGGVFLLDGRVVFYRYPVAKKIDFRGRDALYCVLGAVSRAEAARMDPAALFARPEFAGPMQPFPTALEMPDAEPSAVPAWLKNLDRMTLDVRIVGQPDNPRYVVKQENGATLAASGPIPVPEPPPRPIVRQPSPEPLPAAEPICHQPKTKREAEPEPETVKERPTWMRAGVALLVSLIAALSALAIVYCWRRHVCSQERTPDRDPAPASATNPAPVNVKELAPTNAPQPPRAGKPTVKQGNGKSPETKTKTNGKGK